MKQRLYQTMKFEDGTRCPVDQHEREVAALDPVLRALATLPLKIESCQTDAPWPHLGLRISLDGHTAETAIDIGLIRDSGEGLRFVTQTIRVVIEELIRENGEKAAA